jgi:hypothetical protein
MDGAAIVTKRRLIAGLQSYAIEIIAVVHSGKDSEVQQASKPDF